MREGEGSSHKWGVRKGPGRESGQGRAGVAGRREPDLVLSEGKGMKPWGPAERMETGNIGR